MGLNTLANRVSTDVSETTDIPFIVTLIVSVFYTALT